MNKNFYAIIFSILIGAATTTAHAQVAQGGNFTLEQTVVVAGGGNSAAMSANGNEFAITGTTGQPLAARRAANPPFNVQSGFWTSESAPTAASVAIGGRVLTETGGGLRNARVTLIDAQGNSRTVLTKAFGYYRFAEVAAGQSVIVSVASKRYQFTAQVVTVNQEIEDLNFSVDLPETKF